MRRKVLVTGATGYDEGVRRVVVASSNHAADWYEPLIHAGRIDPIGPEVIPYSSAGSSCG